MPQNAEAVVQQKIAPLADPADWTPPEASEPTFSANQMVAAYGVGQQTAVQKIIEMMEELRERNIDRAAADTAKIVKALEENNITPISARLKVADWNQLEVMFVFNNSNDEGLMKVYDYAGDLMDAESDKFYSITFRFCEQTDFLDEKQIIYDGFVRTYRALSK